MEIINDIQDLFLFDLMDISQKLKRHVHSNVLLSPKHNESTKRIAVEHPH